MEEVEIKTTEEMQEIKNEEIENNKEKNNKFLIFVIALIILIILILGYLIFRRLQKETTNQKDPILSTKSDDATISDGEESADGNELYIYKQGFADMPPIAFTYKCKSNVCDIRIEEKNILLYDNNEFKYREMTSYEYTQIYDSEVNAVGEKLDTTDFELVGPVYNPKTALYKNGTDKSYMEDSYLTKIYNVKENLYYFYDDKIKTIEEYNNSSVMEEYEDESIRVVDNYILGETVVFDYVKNELVYCAEHFIRYSIHKNEGDYNIFYLEDTGEDNGPIYYIIDKNNKVYYIDEDEGYYVKDNKLYYIETSNEKNQVVLIDSASKNLNYNNDGIIPIFIYEDKLMYVDKDKTLKLKNIVSNSIIHNYELKLNHKEYLEFYLNKENKNEIEFTFNDCSIVENEDFDAFLQKENISKDIISSLEDKTCNCSLGIEGIIGYQMKFNSEWKLISKDYIFEIY